MSSPAQSTIKLKKLQRYVDLKHKQWQQQPSSFVEQSEANQQVQFICQHLYATNQKNATFVANWFKQTIAQTPTYLSHQENAYLKSNLAKIFEQLSQKIEQLVASFPTSTSADKDCLLESPTNATRFSPESFEQLSHQLQNKLQNQGGNKFSLAEAANIYKKIPNRIREQGEAAIENYFKERIAKNRSHWKRHWKQALPKTNPGSTKIPSKEILDFRVIQKIRRHFNYSAPVIVKNSAKAGGMAFLFEGGLRGVENLFAIQRGEKTVEQGIQDTLKQAMEAGTISFVTIAGMSVIAITPVAGPMAIGVRTFSVPMLTIVATPGTTKYLIDLLSRIPMLKGVNNIRY